MPTSPSSSVQAARKALADRLRDLCKDAGLSGLELARLAGWHASKSSRIINAVTPPSDDDIRTWCRVCGADDQAADLIAASRSADSMYVEWKRLQRTGLRRLQDSYVPLFERTRVFRVYCSTVVPGLLQNHGYATALLSSITRFRGTPDDVADAVSARLARSNILREGGHRFAVIIEESVLRYRVGDADAMSGQLGYLLAVMSLPAVSLGVIPFSAERDLWPLETFSIYDSEQAQVETLTAAVTVTAPGEIAQYLSAFQKLSDTAVYGSAARALITAAIDALG
ncbi:helix-turn-helix domain-containing protein [Kitasatospora sp. LaBMicrA B282]|uniref:helix-turn-helix domain-containing protein n=1 Tax=Kitasatospora sp. LaBMicrA B282 TaxID=3420949 RepID=UPI003D0D955D